MKKKLIALLVCLAMLAIALVGGTMAYFTDKEEKTNTFTAGNVAITLDEATVVEDAAGNLVVVTGRTTEATTMQNYHIYPAQKITKDPTITVASPSEATYVAAKIIVTNDSAAGDLHNLPELKMPNTTEKLININGILYGGLLERTPSLKADYNNLAPVFGDATYSVYQVRENENKYVFYIFMEDAMSQGDSIKLFDHIIIPARWDNAEMNNLKGLNIKVEAYAVQQHGFDSCFKAITAAFGQEAGDPFKF